MIAEPTSGHRHRLHRRRRSPLGRRWRRAWPPPKGQLTNLGTNAVDDPCKASWNWTGMHRTALRVVIRRMKNDSPFIYNRNEAIRMLSTGGKTSELLFFSFGVGRGSTAGGATTDHFSAAREIKLIERLLPWPIGGSRKINIWNLFIINFRLETGSQHRSTGIIALTLFAFRLLIL